MRPRSLLSSIARLRVLKIFHVAVFFYPVNCANLVSKSPVNLNELTHANA